MSQVKKYETPNGTGIEVRQNLNKVIEAIATSNAGDNEPLELFAGMEWFDTSDPKTYYLKKRNFANDGWQIILRYDVKEKMFFIQSLDGVYTKKQTDETFATKEELSDKLAKNAKAADSEKLGGISANSFLKNTDIISATTLKTPRKISITGNGFYGSSMFDGSSDLSLNLSCAGCSGTCSGCTGSCVGSCTGTCAGACSGCSNTCKGNCSGSCSSSCVGGCGGSCSGSCGGGCSNGCNGR